MINKLRTDVSLENYNNWYPLTGKITETPQQYIQNARFSNILSQTNNCIIYSNV